jgi:hypothetical protein
MGFENTGRVWTPSTFPEYLATIKPPAWATSITLHHCGAPSLAQRPNGFLAQHLANLRHFYEVNKGWSSAPHLFVDEDQLWGMCPFTKRGIHAVSFNATSIGIEVLGDYNVENPKAGRGLACWRTTALATKALADWLKLPINSSTILFHRDDPETKKTCPGTKVQKDWVLSLINAATVPNADPVPDKTDKPTLDVTLANNQWRFIGERWCIPVRAYLLKKGVTDSTIAANLKKRGNQFFFGDELLEGAFFDVATSSTWAPVHELTSLVP